MTYQEKKSIITFLTTSTVTLVYFFYVFTVYHDGSEEALNDLQLWGKAILILIPVQVIAHILLHIIFAIVHKIATGEDLPSKPDERDKLIELKANRNSNNGWMFGFLFAMGALALGYGPFIMFVVMVSAGLFSGIVETLSTLYYYRRGI